MYGENVEHIQLKLIGAFDDDHIQLGELFIVKPFDSLATIQHRSLIEFIKAQLQHKRIIRPILVKQVADNYYQRLDGFCRFWAYKELGRDIIPCVFGEEKGGQSNLSPIL